MSNRSTDVFVSCVMKLVLIMIISTLFVAIIMGLWNWLAPLFWAEAPILTFWQTFGVTILLSMIVGIFSRSSSKK